MPTESTNLPEQEHSIKARAHEVYVEAPRPAAPTKAVKPFPVYLRETPAEPLTQSTKVVLWIAAAIVFVLLLAALWRLAQRQGPKPRTPPPLTEARAAIAGMGHGSRGAAAGRVFYFIDSTMNE
jgi:hypothetical protein